MPGRLLVPLMVLFAGLACDAVRPVERVQPSALVTCTRCHGAAGRGNAAPPRSSTGAIATTDPGVGAHQSHLVAGHFRTPLACQECHQVPQTVDEPGHMGGIPAAVRFDASGSSGLARARGVVTAVEFATATGVAPQARPDATCTVYCHGATLDGGKRTRPGWAGSYDPAHSTLDCESCHGFPPGGRHPQHFEPTPDAPARACARCHSRTGGADGALDLAGGKHINGVVDFAGGEACSACHGDASRHGVIGSDPLVSAAPPVSVTGAAAGAHLAHVNGGGALLRAPLACAECHAHSAEETAGQHPDATTDVDFGPLASAASAAPAWGAAAGSCAATYCHGATLGGGTQKNPRWTGGPDEAACGTCHGVPPPAPHVQNSACGSCHPGYTQTSVNLARHVDGKVDVGPLTCGSCHGGDASPAPPTGTRGEIATTSRAVGAHRAHLASGGLAAPVACDACHAVPTSMRHATGTVELTWSGLSVQGGARPRFDATTTRCAATYCHGQFAGGIAANAPLWTGGSGEVACGTCHGLPPPPPHVRNTSCGKCHPGYGPGSVNATTHVNGVKEFETPTCTSCHGESSRVLVPGADPSAKAAPPADLAGLNASSAIGAHQAHLNRNGITTPIACNECHPVPASLGHADGTLDLVFTGRAVQGGAIPTFAGGTCSSTYCHGNYEGTYTYSAWDWALDQAVDVTVSYVGKKAAPGWMGASMACDSCHGNPPPGAWHSAHGGGNQCELCHPDAIGTSAGVGTTITNPALHVNGAVDVIPQWKTSCSYCH